MPSMDPANPATAASQEQQHESASSSSARRRRRPRDDHHDGRRLSLYDPEAADALEMAKSHAQCRVSLYSSEQEKGFASLGVIVYPSSWKDKKTEEDEKDSDDESEKKESSDEEESGGTTTSASEYEDEGKSSEEEEREKQKASVGEDFDAYVKQDADAADVETSTSVESPTGKSRSTTVREGLVSSSSSSGTPTIMLPLPPQSTERQQQQQQQTDNDASPCWAVVAPTALLSSSSRENTALLNIQETDADKSNNDNDDETKQERQLRHWETVSTLCQEYLHISRSLSTTNTKKSKSHTPVIVILLLRSGRFAGGVFTTCPSAKPLPNHNHNNKKTKKPTLLHATCLDHTTKTRYTVRRGQGGSQSAKDNVSNSKPISVGARLRRQGEVDLRQDVVTTLQRWQEYIDRACLILWSCPNSMKKAFFEDNASVVSKGDKRWRDVKLAVKKPSFEEVCRVHELLMTVMVRPMTEVEEVGMDRLDSVQEAEENANVKGKPKLKNPEKDDVEEKVDEQNEASTFVPLTPLHKAAACADLDTLRRLLHQTSSSLSNLEPTDDPSNKDDTDDDDHNDGNNTSKPFHHDDIDIRAGPKAYTPLHYAASSFPPSTTKLNSKDEPPLPSAPSAQAAAQTITLLLLHYHANPSMVDAHGRPPYHLATHDTLRNAFRMARSQLGEEAWDWKSAKVGPPLSQQDLQERKEKQALKKKRQKARQKQKRAAEKRAAEEERVRLEKEEEERKKKEEEKRTRDGLKPKKKQGTGYACDFCEKVCKKRSSMFARLEYWYCSTECVKRHQRELMANAAAARLSST